MLQYFDWPIPVFIRFISFYSSVVENTFVGPVASWRLCFVLYFLELNKLIHRLSLEEQVFKMFKTISQ